MKLFEYLKYLEGEAKKKSKIKQGELKELFLVSIEWFQKYIQHCYADLVEGIAIKKQIDISKA